MTTIITSLADYRRMLSSIGVTEDDFDSEDAFGLTYLEQAEELVKDELALQAINGVQDADTIMAGTNGSAIHFLKTAVVYYCCYLYTIASTNAVDTSVTQGEIEKSLGGIGSQWREQGKEFLKEAAMGSLAKLPNWQQFRRIPLV